MGAEKQMLHHLPHLQLGLCHDVHTADFHPGYVYLQSDRAVGAAADPVGGDGSETSGTFCGEQQRLSGLQKLSGEALPSQKAAAELSEAVAKNTPVRVIQR
jgi:hypothetical protein